MAKAIGIDLGTTYTAVAVIDEYGKASIVKNMEGQATTPSVVYIDHPYYSVGEVALQSTLTDPERVSQFIKRSMGLADHRVIIGERSFSPEFISSIILRKVIHEASITLGEAIESVVITVPAYFTKAQRQATYNAGQLAGLNVLRLINEPTAAALSYGVASMRALAAENAKSSLPSREFSHLGRKFTLGKSQSQAIAQRKLAQKPRCIMVYDLGGGTFDVTVLSVTPVSLDVIAVGGESHLGGKDFDDCIMNFVETQFEEKYGVPLNPDASLESELRLKAEQAKRQLTSRPNTPITFKAKAAFNNNGVVQDTIIPARIELSRVQFEKLTAGLIERTQICLTALMEQANLEWSDIDEVLCVGGSSRMPMVRELLRKLSGRTPLLHDPDECVAKGAAIQASIILNEATSKASGGDIFDVTQMSINHVLPHTLGVATSHDEQTLVEPIIRALTPLPCANASEEFTTTVDDQTQVSVLIYEGESTDPQAYPHGPIGIFHLDTSPPRPKGIPKIRVEFRCDENGRIVAVARDKDTGKESRAYIHLGSARSEEEMQLEAEWLSEALIS
jgi:molecular chaperone DnaK